MKHTFSLLLLVTIFIISCTSDKGPVTETIVMDDCDTTNGYVDGVEAIISANCNNAGCHDAGSSNGDFTTYEGVKLYADNGKLNNRVLVLQDMPLTPVAPLTESQKSVIKCWLTNGATENGTNATATVVSFSTVIAPLISTNCASVTGCHDGGSPNGDFTSYAGLKIDADNGRLNTRVVVQKNMPISPVNPLSAMEIADVEKWITEGALNN